VAAQQGEYLRENQSFAKVLHWLPSQIRWDFNCHGVVSSLKIVRKCLYTKRWTRPASVRTRLPDFN
jgi:hypothetical protein